LPQNPGQDFTVCSAANDCTTGSWPAWGDIVVMTVRSEHPTEVLHTASYAKEDATLGLTRGQGGATTDLGAPVSDGYHDYAISWGPRRVEWFIDGELRASFDTTAADIVAPEGARPFEQPFYVKLLLAVGGLAEAPDATQYPQEMRVRSLKVWQSR
jgi:beta-glucanase (GH16 family)